MDKIDLELNEKFHNLFSGKLNLSCYVKNGQIVEYADPKIEQLFQGFVLGYKYHNNMDNITTKVTRVGPKLWGCRIWYKDILCCETTVRSRMEISSAFKSMLRMLDKCGYDSKMAHSSRHRNNHMPISNCVISWLR